MPLIFDVILLFLLFTSLGFIADFAVKNIRYIGAILKVRLFVFGIILGLITTLPELALGINTTLDEVGAISVGNILGGLMVILGLVLGANLFISKKTVTDGRLKSIIPTALVIFSPIILGIDGVFNRIDGFILISFYILLVFYLYRINHFHGYQHVQIKPDKIARSIIFSITGVIGILFISNWIVEITLDLLNYLNVSKLVIGLLIFSIGTNLPEISIALTSWRKKTGELSLSHLLSSAFTNILVLGLLVVFNPIYFNVNTAYWITGLFIFIILILLVYFYRSEKSLSRKEGFILFFLYFLFLITNMFFL